MAAEWEIGKTLKMEFSNINDLYLKLQYETVMFWILQLEFQLSKQVIEFVSCFYLISWNNTFVNIEVGGSAYFQRVDR